MVKDESTIMAPRYFRLAELLREDIHANFSSGDRFYSQRELMRNYNLSLTTVERALGVLCREGLLERRHGKGTFVSEPSGVRNTSVLRSICLATAARDNNDLEEYYTSTLLMGIKGALNGLNISLSFTNYDNLELTMESQGCVGVIMVAPYEEHKDMVQAIARNNTPVVVVGSQWPDTEAPTVDSDVAEGTRQAVNYLISKGHTSIGYVTPRIDSVFNVGVGVHALIRESAFRSRLQELGVGMCEDWVFRLDYGMILDSDREHLRRIFLAGQGPSALIVSIHRSTLPLLAELKSMGLSIPKDVSLICWDDPSWAAYTEPPLTVIRQPLGEIGPRAVTKLLDQIDGRGVFARKEILPVEIVERSSVADIRENIGHPQIYQSNRG